jgi:hypothetical protein
MERYAYEIKILLKNKEKKAPPHEIFPLFP